MTAPADFPAAGAVTLVWADGSTTEGANATDVLERLASTAWVTYTRDEYKTALALRTALLTGASVDPLLPDDEYLAAIGAESGLFTIRT